MIRFVLFTIFVFNIFNIYSQKNLEIEVSYTHNKKQIKNVKYYIVDDNNAILIEKDRTNKLVIDSKYLLNEKNELKLLVVTNITKIEFFINAKDIYYLKISKMPFSLKNLFKKLYIIDQGFDDIMIIKQSKNRYNFIEKE